MHVVLCLESMTPSMKDTDQIGIPDMGPSQLSDGKVIPDPSVAVGDRRFIGWYGAFFRCKMSRLLHVSCKLSGKWKTSLLDKDIVVDNACHLSEIFLPFLSNFHPFCVSIQKTTNIYHHWCIHHTYSPLHSTPLHSIIYVSSNYNRVLLLWYHLCCTYQTLFDSLVCGCNVRT